MDNIASHLQDDNGISRSLKKTDRRVNASGLSQDPAVTFCTGLKRARQTPVGLAHQELGKTHGRIKFLFGAFACAGRFRFVLGALGNAQDLHSAEQARPPDREQLGSLTLVSLSLLESHGDHSPFDFFKQ
jgi:hypothetical protein